MSKTTGRSTGLDVPIDQKRPAKIESIPLTRISDAEDLQCRVQGLRSGHVATIVVALDHNWDVGPIKVVYDGLWYYPYDGWHRIEAHKRLRRKSIVAEVMEGTKSEAVLLSTSANKEHGLTRSRADKQRAVKIAIEHPLTAGWSDQRIAKFIGVSPGMVNDWRPFSISEDNPRLGTNGRLYHGRKRETPKPEAVAPKPPVAGFVWPRWLIAPFIAMDRDGDWSAFSAPPKINRPNGYWQTDGDEAPLSLSLFDFTPPTSHDWADSLLVNPHGRNASG